MPLTRRRALAVLGTGAVAGCSDLLGEGEPPSGGPAPEEIEEYDTSVDHDGTAWDRYDPDWEPPTDAPTDGGVEATVLVENLEVPWDLSFTPDGDLFLTERTGRITRFDQFTADGGETVVEPDAVIDAEALPPGSDESPWVVEGGEGGLLGVAVHPTFPDPPLVYTYYTTDEGNGPTNRVDAFDASADDPSARSWNVVDGIPGHTFHNGGRIAFGPANYLWIATGDGDPGLDNPGTIRDPGTLAGKILRVKPNGEAPADNPDLGDGADPRVFTYGHRNPQGISWLPDATPVVTEHGPGGGDEVNVLRAGDDYGWPEARHSDNFGSYAGSPYQAPVATAPSWAPSGSVFYTGERLDNWQNRLLFGGLISQQLVAVTVSPADGPDPAAGHDRLHGGDGFDDAYRAGTSPLFAGEFGRVRHVEQGPDGAVYAVTSNRDGRTSDDDPFPTQRDDLLVRFEPR